MPDYKAHFLMKSPLELQFYDRNGNPIGSLKLKPSTLQWISYGDKKKRSVPIEKFIKWIEDPATRTALVRF